MHVARLGFVLRMTHSQEDVVSASIAATLSAAAAGGSDDSGVENLTGQVRSLNERHLGRNARIESVGRSQSWMV